MEIGKFLTSMFRRQNAEDSIQKFLPHRHSGVGIGLEEDRIEVVRVRGGQGAFDVAAHAVIPFSKTVYEHGRVLDIERFASELNHAFHMQGLPKRGITLSLPSSVVALRILSMPDVNRKQMRELLEFQIREEIRLPIANPVFDFDYYPASIASDEPGKEDGTKENGVLILLAAAPGDLVNGLVDGFREAGLRLAAIEAKGFSILRGMKALDKLPETGTIVTEFGTEYVDAHFYQNGVLLMTRSLDLRADDYVRQFDTPLLQEVAVAQEGGDSRREPVESGTCSPPSGWSLLNGEENEARLDSFASDLAFQFQRFISFVQYILKRRDTMPDTIFLTGQVPNAKRLSDYLSAQLDLAVKQLNVPVVHQPGSPPLPKISLSVTGAALRGGVSDAD